MYTKEIGPNLYLIDLETGGSEGQFASYVLKGAKSIIVETGPTSSVGNLLSGLRELGIKQENVIYVAVSHVHLDHGGGTGALLKSLPNARVIVHSRGAAHLVDPSKLWLQSKEVLGEAAQLYGAPEPVPQERIVIGEDGMIIDAGKRVALTVVETLGHASHHLSFYSHIHNGIFPGDAAGIYLSEFDAIIPTTPPPFRFDAALLALKKLEDLKPRELYYSHFGKGDDAITKLRNYAKQLQLWAEITKEGARNKQSFGLIVDRILKEDKEVGKISSFLKSNPILMKTAICNSVKGFMGFAESENLT